MGSNLSRTARRAALSLCLLLAACGSSDGPGRFAPPGDADGGVGIGDAVGDGGPGLDARRPGDTPGPVDTFVRDAPADPADARADVPRDVPRPPRDIPPPPDVPPRDVWRPDIPSPLDVPADVPPDVPADVPPDVTADGAGPVDVPVGPDTAPPVGTTLTIHALDLWAQALPLPSQGTELTVAAAVTGAALPVDRYAFPWARVDLPGPGSWDVVLTHPDHHPARVRVTWSGSHTAREAVTAVLLDAPDPARAPGLAVSHERPGAAWEHTVHIGLRHRWFAPSGPPARRGNRVRLLMDGEEAWRTVHTTLRNARSSILLSTWWWVSTFELIRELPAHLSLTAADRWENTIYMVLWRTPAVIRTLVGQFWGQDSILSWLTTDSDLEAIAEDPDDYWEFMGQGNPASGVFTFAVPTFRFSDRVRDAWAETDGATFDSDAFVPSVVPSRVVDLTDFPLGFETEIASWHQKFMVIDFETAYIGGMNLRGTDWDTSEHLVFDPRRFEFGATADERWEVHLKEAQTPRGPRKDYMVQLQGPSVADAAAVFRDRWDLALANEVEFSENASPFAVPAPPAPFTDGVQAQVAATMPAPFRRADILESWWNAIEQAEDYIFIEDQYWRIPVIMDALVARMQAVPGLRLLVVTKPVSEWTDPGCRWTHETNALLAEQFPTRYRTYQLRSFDHAVVCTLCFDETEAFFPNVDVHSKLLIVDDRFLSVGSCNKNNRGVTYEGELNLEVLDADWVAAARRRIVANMLGFPLGAASDFDDVWQAFAAAAAANDQTYALWDAEGFDRDLDGAAPGAEWIPEGFVYSLSFRSVDDCLIEDIGPDFAK